MDKCTQPSEIILINDDYYQALLNDIEQATTSIDLEVYIFDSDTLGQTFADAFIRAALRGVTVRILVDGAGSLFWGDQMTKQLEAAGVKTRVFHPLPWMFWNWGRAAHVPVLLVKKIFYLLTKINYRNHRKTCRIDEKIIYVSSANISNNKWRDTTIKLTDVETSYLRFAFEVAWNHVPLRIRRQLKHADVTKQFHLNYSWRHRRFFYRLLLNKLAHSQKRIWVTNAYFVPDNFLLNRLIKAARRGVDVKILLPQKSDVLITSLVSTTFYAALIKNGVHIYEYLPSMLHAKTLIIDDWFCVGSSNLNYRSLKHDLEVDVTVSSLEAKETIEAQFFKDLAASQLIDIHFLKKLAWYKRALGRLLLFFRYWI